MNILSKDILPLKTSQKFSSVLEPYAVKVASTVLRRGCHCEVMFLSDFKEKKDISNTYKYYEINTLFLIALEIVFSYLRMTFNLKINPRANIECYIFIQIENTVL